VGLRCSDTLAGSALRRSHAAMCGKPVCCKDSEPLYPLAATLSAAMRKSVPALWAIRMTCLGVYQSHYWHSCEQLHSFSQEHTAGEAEQGVLRMRHHTGTVGVRVNSACN
jgi:hypothetical protein